MPQGYATIPSGRTRVNLFPCSVSNYRPDNSYWRASQRLQEQERQQILPKPSLPEQAGSAEGSTAQALVALTEAYHHLGMDDQCIILDPAALSSSLTSSKMCSKRALKKLTTELKPAVIKLQVGTDVDDDDALGDVHLHHLLHSLQSKAITALERSCETMQLQTPLLPQVSAQVRLLTYHVVS